ncbi:glucose-1-phosphate cytidylyltransferase [Candidatus Woesearchaeota archaeon]|nr:glucose-1-phosphate cytidylyltransferase [Candidatus Woesearchaeota archaeon]
MKVVILCGGKGTRLKEKTEFIPKVLVEIGGYPILWHIMKIYSHFGFKDFVLLLGYKGEMIKEYFANNETWKKEDFRLDMKKKEISYIGQELEDWTIEFIDTGPDTNTGGRIKKIQHLIKDDTFLCTYGDGVADIDIKKTIEFHKKHDKIATMAVVNPLSQFGIVEIGDDDVVTGFKEKPKLKSWINGGFFVFNKKIFDFIGENDVFEKDPLERLVKKGQLAAFKFQGFWECMDTYKDNEMLNDLWHTHPPWKVWK